MPFPRKGLAQKRFLPRKDTTYLIKKLKLYNWLFYVSRELSGLVYGKCGTYNFVEHCLEQPIIL
jgi:hypothetical protein